MQVMNNEYEIYWLKPGTVLAEKYRIEDVISEGGFGIVYLGFDMVLNMNVAIKEYFPKRFAMRGQDSSAVHVYKGKSGIRFKEGLDKFLNEARILAKLNGLDSIVTVRDFFYENNTAYIINEHVVGENVKEYIEKNGKMEAGQVLEIMKPILFSLEKIHEKGLLHRDISPDNIIMQREKAVLIDFGAARFFQEQEDKSMTVFFKRGYSAQEQYIRSGKQGAYTDIYAVCTTMYFMLTGEQPEESVQRQIKDNVIPLTKWKDVEMSIRAKEAIMKGMSVQVKGRYKTIGELCSDLFGEEKKAVWLYRILLLLGIFLILWLSGFYLVERFAEGTQKTPLEDIPVVAETSPKPDQVSQEVLGVDEGDLQNSDMYYQIPDVTGLRREDAIQKIKKKSPKHFQIVEKKVYSDTVKKGRVVSQSRKAGKRYRAGEVNRILLRISKGTKPKAEQPVEQEDDRPDTTAVPKEAAVKGKKKQSKEKEGFAGALPW